MSARASTTMTRSSLFLCTPPCWVNQTFAWAVSVSDLEGFYVCVFVLFFLVCFGFGHNHCKRAVNEQYIARFVRVVPTAELTVLMSFHQCKVVSCLPVVLDVFPRSHGSDFEHSFGGVGCHKADIQGRQHIGVPLTLTPAMNQCLKLYVLLFK